MKRQQVSIDFTNMVFTVCSYLALAGAMWIFLRLLQACFWLPKHFKRQNNVQQMLQDKVDSYEKYVLDCEEKEMALAKEGENELDENGKPKNAIDQKQWKERRECLDMLKRELQRVQEGGNMYDWDALMEEEKRILEMEDDEENEDPMSGEEKLKSEENGTDSPVKKNKDLLKSTETDEISFSLASEKRDDNENVEYETKKGK